MVVSRSVGKVWWLTIGAIGRMGLLVFRCHRFQSRNSVADETRNRGVMEAMARFHIVRLLMSYRRIGREPTAEMVKRPQGAPR